MSMMMLAARLGQCAAGHANTRVTPSAGAAVQRARRCVSSSVISSPSSAYDYYALRRQHRPFRVSAARWMPPSGDDEPEEEKQPTNTQALIESLGAVSQTMGRDPKGKVTTVMGDGGSGGGLGANLSWEELDEKVNTYPSDRKFQAIGEGGEAFVKEIVGLVEGALGRDVKPENVTSR